MTMNTHYRSDSFLNIGSTAQNPSSKWDNLACSGFCFPFYFFFFKNKILSFLKQKQNLMHRLSVMESFISGSYIQSFSQGQTQALNIHIHCDLCSAGYGYIFCFFSGPSFFLTSFHFVAISILTSVSQLSLQSSPVTQIWIVGGYSHGERALICNLQQRQL